MTASEIEIFSRSSVKVTEDTKLLMQELAPEITKTAMLVKEITASSIEQNSGTRQINDAVQQLSQVIQQNSASSEEMASSSEELSSQAEMLKQLISFFKINAKTDLLTEKDMSFKNKLNKNKPQITDVKKSVGVKIHMPNDEQSAFENF